jgi:hypothetical protein
MTNRISRSVGAGAKKGSADTRPLLTPPPRGRPEQHMADAPHTGGVRPSAVSDLKSLAAQVGGFVRKQNLTFARHSNCQHGRASHDFVPKISPLRLSRPTNRRPFARFYRQFGLHANSPLLPTCEARRIGCFALVCRSRSLGTIRRAMGQPTT